MNRRTFGRTLAGSALAAALPRPAAAAPASTGPLPFQLSVMLWTVFKKLPFDQRLEKVAAAGFQNIELVGEFEKWTPAEWNRFLAKKRELKLNFDGSTGVHHQLADPEQQTAFLADVRAVLPVLDRLECPALIMQTGNRIPNLPHAVQYLNCVETLRKAGKMLAGTGHHILVENIDPLENPRYFLTSAAEGLEMMAAVGDPRVKFLYDFYHEQIAEGNLIAKLNRYLDQVGVVHIADVPGRHDPGTGEIDYGNIFKRLVALNFRGTAAMEFMPLGDEVAGLRAARQLALSAARA